MCVHVFILTNQISLLHSHIQLQDRAIGLSALPVLNNNNSYLKEQQLYMYDCTCIFFKAKNIYIQDK